VRSGAGRSSRRQSAADSLVAPGLKRFGPKGRCGCSEKPTNQTHGGTPQLRCTRKSWENSKAGGLRVMWVYNPHVGGKIISKDVRRRTTYRIQRYAAEHHAGKFARIDVRFRGALCYVDVYTEPDPDDRYVPEGQTHEEYLDRLRNTPLHLCRLRYFGNEDDWSISFYSYAHMKYEPSFLVDGNDCGTPELAFETVAPFLSP
jgi:hypothetical protein